VQASQAVRTDHGDARSRAVFRQGLLQTLDAIGHLTPVAKDKIAGPCWRCAIGLTRFNQNRTEFTRFIFTQLKFAGAGAAEPLDLGEGIFADVFALDGPGAESLASRGSCDA
jgi:hypothetical protein